MNSSQKAITKKKKKNFPVGVRLAYDGGYLSNSSLSLFYKCFVNIRSFI